MHLYVLLSIVHACPPTSESQEKNIGTQDEIVFTVVIYGGPTFRVNSMFKVTQADVVRERLVDWCTTHQQYFHAIFTSCT